jgi:hypothetical protein
VPIVATVDIADGTTIPTLINGQTGPELAIRADIAAPLWYIVSALLLSLVPASLLYMSRPTVAGASLGKLLL